MTSHSVCRDVGSELFVSGFVSWLWFSTGSAQDHVIGLVQPLKELLLLIIRKEAGFGRFDVLEDKRTKKKV